MKTLITYFSAQGTTAKVAKELAAMTGADIFEIRPEKPYTAADLKWTNPLARCNREMLGRRDVPIEGRIADFEQYDTILIGFPIWYGAAPNVINTLLLPSSNGIMIRQPARSAVGRVAGLPTGQYGDNHGMMAIL